LLNLDLNLTPLQTLRPCPWNGASMGKEAVLADSGQAGEIVSGVGRVKSLAILNSLPMHTCRFARMSTIRIDFAFRPGGH